MSLRLDESDMRHDKGTCPRRKEMPGYVPSPRAYAVPIPPEPQSMQLWVRVGAGRVSAGQRIGVRVVLRLPSIAYSL